MRIRHWQDYASASLGFWMILSPLVLGFSGAAAGFSIALGIAIMAFAIEGLLLPSYLEEVGEFGLGLVTVFTPWLIGFASSAASYYYVATGVLVMVFAAWEMMTDREFMTWWQHHTHHSAI